MSFLLVKKLHVLFVAGNYILFFLRGLWSFSNSQLLQQRWVKIAPHVVDTLLLLCAVELAITIGQYPFVDSWLTAKTLALLFYVGLGFIALNKKLDKAIRLPAWLAAQATFAYIALVAIHHNPAPW